MAELTVNSIYDGVTLALYTAFPDRHIYGGEVEQGIHAGDLNVILTGGTESKEVGLRRRRTVGVDVICYLEAGADPAEGYAMAGRLPPILETIVTPQGDSVHATDLSWSVSDGALHVLVSYPCFVHTIPVRESMGEIELKQEGR